MNTFKPGDKVRCVDDAYAEGVLEVGRVYTVRGSRDVPGAAEMWLEFPHSSWLTSRFEPIAKTDMDLMKEMLTKAGVTHRSWRIHEYTATSGGSMYLDGYVLVHGSEDIGPYTEYVFDLAGNIRQVSSCHDEGFGPKMV